MKQWILPVLCAALSLGAIESSKHDYLPLFAKRARMTAETLRKPQPKRPNRADPRFNATSMITQAELCYRYGKAAAEPEFVKLGVEMYDRFPAMNPVTGRYSDFHLTRPWALLTWRLDRDGLLTGERRARTLELARAYLNHYYGRNKDGRLFAEELWDHNIHQAEMVAADALAIVFAAEKELPVREIRELAKEFADRILANGDLNENATNYAPLGTAFFLELLALEDRTQELRKNAGFRNQFSRWRDFAGPAVIFPEIGDSYFKHELLPLDVVLMMEAGARLFDDPSFAAEARRIMQRDNGKPDDDLIFRALPLMELDTYHSAAKPAAPALSQVQYRAGYGGNGRPTVPDKLILRTGSQPGDAMIMLDLYARGSHAHEFHRPSIAYFEAGGAALFHNLGRRGTTSGNHANVVWLEEAFDRFPGHPKPGVWNTMTIPVNRLQPAERAGEYRLTNRLDFRTFRQPTLKSITFDNLRLEGAGGTLLIDGFESPGLWTRYTRNLPKISIETVDDRTEGVHAQRVGWNIFNGQVVNRDLPPEFRNRTVKEREYDLVRFDYKYDGPLPYCNLRGWCRRWMDFGNAALECEVDSAEVRQLGSDAWGRVVFRDYMGPGNRLERRMLLTKEGVLAVVDRFTPAPRFAGRTVGQLWQLYTRAEQGEDWFAAESDGRFPQVDGVDRPERRTLVKFYRPIGTECGVEEFTPGYMHAYKIGGKRYNSFFTAYSRRKTTSAPVTMAQLVFPLLPEDDPARTARAARFDAAADGTVKVEFETPGSGRKVQATITGRGAEVKRR